ncbi:plakophilin-2 [Neosynchiropus ocellatus]
MEIFLKSPFSVVDPCLLDDSTLALPAEPNLGRSPRLHEPDRSHRVQQQVQLSLRRRARRTHGPVPSNMTKSFHESENLGSKVFPPLQRSLSGPASIRRPSRRIEVSPPPSPEPTRFHFSTFTLTGPAPPSASLSHHSPVPLWRYAFSEAPQNSRLHTSSSATRGLRQRAVRVSQDRFMSHPSVVHNGFQTYPPVVQDQVPSHPVVNQDRLPSHRPLVENRFQGTTNRQRSMFSHQRDHVLPQVNWEEPRLNVLKSGPPSVKGSQVQTLQTRNISSGCVHRNACGYRLFDAHLLFLISTSGRSTMTVERAVKMLDGDDADSLVSAATHIQKACLHSERAKQTVSYRGGIRKLLLLLSSDSEEVQRASVAALRNVVFQNNDNKMEVKDNEGLTTIVRVLKESRDHEVRRHLTGLLWNLSSHDLLKEALSRLLLPALTKMVLVPCSGVSEGENPKDELLADDQVFRGATFCLRNLSGCGPDGRRRMRECENLVDSLVYYVRKTVADYNTHDQATENCVSVLHNLSYQMEAELPRRYAAQFQVAEQKVTQTKPVGCFSHRGHKEEEPSQQQRSLLEEKANPRGVEWLWSAITIRMYLSIMARSFGPGTQEGSVGALQNLTAGTGPMTEGIATAIVRENGLQHVKKMLAGSEDSLRKTTISLIKNLSRYRQLHADIVKHLLAELIEVLPGEDAGGDPSSEVTSALCSILVSLSHDVQNSRSIVSQGALPKVRRISCLETSTGPSRAAQSASLLLHSLWKHTDLHGLYKKFGFRKSDFINARTAKAIQSS